MLWWGNSNHFENENYLKVRNDSDQVDESKKNIEYEEKNDSDEYSDKSEHHENDDDYIPGGGKDEVFQVTLQEELNDLVRDLGLPKDGPEFLTPFMNKRDAYQKLLKLIISETEKKNLKNTLRK